METLPIAYALECTQPCIIIVANSGRLSWCCFIRWFTHHRSKIELNFRIWLVSVIRCNWLLIEERECSLLIYRLSYCLAFSATRLSFLTDWLSFLVFMINGVNSWRCSNSDFTGPLTDIHWLSRWSFTNIHWLSGWSIPEIHRSACLYSCLIEERFLVLQTFIICLRRCCILKFTICHSRFRQPLSIELSKLHLFISYHLLVFFLHISFKCCKFMLSCSSLRWVLLAILSYLLID